MSEMKKYMSIVRLGHKSTAGVLKEGDYIVAFEKLDGANASFKRNEQGELECFSRNTKLDESNNLRGFYQWVHENINPDDLMPNRIYFGEWLVQHKVQYGVNKNQFYLFDVYHETAKKYLDFPTVILEAYSLGLQVAPVLYMGKYQGFDHLMRLVGRSALADNPIGGEGIVVKNYSYRDRSNDQMFVKLVSEAFAEVQPQKLPKDPAAETPESVFVGQFLTKARAEKLLLKLVDEGILDEKFGIENMGTILKNLGSRVLDDIVKEEKDNYPEGVDFDEKSAMKAVGRKLPPIVKEIIKERETVA